MTNRKQEQILRLLETLDKADKLFDEDQYAGALAALHAVRDFLDGDYANNAGRFARPFELLITELRERRPPSPNGIPRTNGGGSGGINSRAGDHYVKAAAAFSVDVLYRKGGMTVDAAARTIARELESHGFPFARRAERPFTAVLAWRTYHLPSGPDFRPRSKSPISLACASYCTNPEIQFTDNESLNRSCTLDWFTNLLARAGYRRVT